MAPHEFDLTTASIADIAAAFDAGALTSERLVQLYLDRIAAYDEDGPRIGAVLTLNGDALETARALDAEFRPVKLNLMTLGNGVPHLHTHVVPRYPGDPAPGGPLPWDAMFLPEPADPDVLRRQADAIRARLG